MEQIFTEKELEEIQILAKSKFEHYHNITVFNGNSNSKSIKTISNEKHLIIVEGNEVTGYKHFNNRHNYSSIKNYWVLNENKVFKLDNPSKFHPKMIPIIDYVKIADTIFLEKNKNITKNNNPELFDKYTGYYKDEENNEEKYHLITYKNTKIIHTFFPDKKKHNLKYKCKYGKGIVSAQFKFDKNATIDDLIVPYENELGITVYTFLIRRYYSEKIEQILIQKHNEEGDPIDHIILGYRDFEDSENFSKKDTISLQNADLSEFEKIINDYDNVKDNY